MLDMKIIRDQPELILNNLEKRRKKDYEIMFRNLIEKDIKWRKLKKQIDELRNKRNELTKKIQLLKQKNKLEEIKKEINEAKEIPEKIKKLEEILKKIETEKKILLLTIPNLLHESVPFGKDKEGNIVIYKWGKKPEFDFTPKSHVDTPP